MSHHFIVEADKKVVGLAVRAPGGFKFVSSDPDYAQLEAKTFPRLKAIARRAEQIAAVRRADLGDRRVDGTLQGESQ